MRDLVFRLVLVLLCSCIISSEGSNRVMPSDGESSSDALFDALAEANGDAPENADPGAAPLAPPGRRWRTKKRLNKERTLRAATRAVATISSKLGRDSKRAAPAGRRHRSNTVSSQTVLDMAFGATAKDDLPSAVMAGTRAGFSKETARRSRKIVLDCLQSSLTDRIASCFLQGSG